MAKNGITKKTAKQARATKDLFELVVPGHELHPTYQRLRSHKSQAPARAEMNRAFKKFVDVDGNFLQQFQTDGFDARVFELYLDTYFRDAGFEINSSYERPDFILSKDGLDICVEATTASRSQKIDDQVKGLQLSTEDEFLHEIPIRFGSALFSKLQKQYWTLPQCANKPFVIAIEAFYSDSSLQVTDSPLGLYLYGLRHFPTWSEDGELIVNAEQIVEHRLDQKVIPPNFFEQPGSENISAILFTNSGTSAKFNRMGYSPVKYPSLTMKRTGQFYDPDPNAVVPRQLDYDLAMPPFQETWGHGLMVFLNPHAKHPIPHDFFPEASQTYIRDGKLLTDVQPYYPFNSLTTIFERK